MSRPRNIATYTWSSAQARGALIGHFDPLRSIISQAQTWNKMTGFQYFRCTARVRFQVTGNAFLGGKLRAVWIPINKVGAFASTDCPVSLPFLTGIQQGVDMVPTDNATYELDIPFVYPERYFDIMKAQNSWPNLLSSAPFGPSADLVSLGLVAIYCISPLVSEDVTDVCTIVPFIELKDIELADVYTYLAPALPSNIVPNLGSAEAAEDTNQWTFEYHAQAQLAVALSQDELVHNASEELIAESNAATATDTRPVWRGKAVGQTTSEQAKKNSGGFLSTVASIISAFSAAMVPFTGPYAVLTAGVSTIAGGAAKILKYYNLDKPLSMQKTTEFFLRWRNMATGDGMAYSAPLALLTGNAVSPVGHNQPFRDEHLSMSYMCSIPQLLAWRQISTATTARSRIFTWTVAPWNVPTKVLQVTNAGTTPTIYPTYASHCASSFEYWRGDFVATLQVVAQGFSKCAIGMSWLPGSILDTGLSNLKNPSPVDITIMTDCLTEVVNVSGTTTATFRIPFANSQYAMRCDANTVVRNINPGTTGFTHDDFPFFNGHLLVYLINPLSNFSPSSPDNNPIDILLYGHWENLCFYRPSTRRINTLPVKAPVTFATSGPAFYVQGDLESDDSKSEDEVYHHNSAEMLNPNEFFGEYTDSVMDLARRPGILASPIGTSSVVGRVSLITSLFSSPVACGPAITNEGAMNTLHNYGATGTNMDGMVPCSFAQYFSDLYVCWRGEVCYTVMDASSNASQFLIDSHWVTFSNYNILNRRSVTTLDRPLLVANQVSLAADLGGGMFFRPEGTPGNPPSISIPYYSPQNFMYVPDTLQISNLSRTLYPSYRGIPGVCISYERNSNIPPPAITVEAGDRFSYSLLYPPRTRVSWVSANAVRPPSL